MNVRLRIPSLIFYALAAIIILASIFSFASALSWVKKPFPGFLIYPTPYIGSFGSIDWAGEQAGLKYMDRIIAVDKQPVELGRDVIELVRGKEPGNPVCYVVKAKGKTREITVPVDLFSWKDFSLVFLPGFLWGLAVYALGAIVYLLKPNTRTSWVFLVLGFSLGIYAITGFEIQSTYYLMFLNSFVMCLFPACFLHLGLIFPEKKRILTRFPALEYLIYIPSIVLIVVYEVYFIAFSRVSGPGSEIWMTSFKLMSTVVRIFTLLAAFGLIIFVFHSTYKAVSIIARRRALMILFGVTIAFGPAALAMAAAIFLKIHIPWNFLAFILLCFPASIAYSIVKHNLFDADTIIKRTVGYFIVTAIVIGAYSLVSVAFNVMLGQYQLAQSKAFPILFTLGVILIFNPLRDRVQSLVDRIFFRKEYDYGAIVDTVSGAMTTMLELPQIAKRLVQTFMDDMFIDTSSVMLLAADGTQYQVYLADGEKMEEVENTNFKRDNPLMEIIEGEKRELTIYDVLEDPKYKAVSEKSSASFEALHASLMVPLIYQDQVIGSLNLGEKKSGKPFNREDVELLRTIANQGAVAIENARLFQENLEKQRMEEELNIARDLQMSMLPAECPVIKGFQIAAYSISAREVGGDFYDFIDMGEDKAGFVIGDVTGKSVSGALVMSASRSVFRMLSEEELNVSESMMRANRRLKKDIKPGMFVALLFAVLDSKDRKLTMCSAGQTQPIHLSSKTGEAKLIETEGDTFPLGILDEADYLETEISLSPGDRVLFYTDGIVEAMNNKEEMFGFELLLDIVKKEGHMNPESLLKEILDRVNEFAGGAAQHDDLTLIVVSVEE